MSALHLDAAGRQWLLVSATRAGKFGWFRPAEHPDDGALDQNFRMDAMRSAEFVERHAAALAQHAASMLARDPAYVSLRETLADIALAGAGGAL